eukprot:s361_g33.t1
MQLDSAKGKTQHESIEPPWAGTSNRCRHYQRPAPPQNGEVQQPLKRDSLLTQLHVDNAWPWLAYVPFFRLIIMLSGSSSGEFTVKLVLHRSDVPSTNIAFRSTRVSIEQGHLDVPWSGNPYDPACPTSQLPHHFLYPFLQR